jgi:ankyrin repeat protein
MHIKLNTLIGWGLLGLATVTLGAAGDVRLVEAVKANNTEAVRALLKQKVDVDASLGDGSTALHWAVHRDDMATVDLLLGAGARANVANDLGATPLHLACTNRNGAMVGKLLKAGADPNATLERGATVLMECARAGDLAAVRALLARGANVNAKEPLHSQTALMWAAAQKHPEVVEALVELGADVKARSRTYAQTVVGEGTQRAEREELNYTILKGGSSPLLFAARSGDVESTRILLAAGADANDLLPNDASALIVAAHSGHGKVAALLLEKGADPNNTAVGYSALHAAVLRSDVELVKTLLAHGAKPDLVITKGTPIRRNSTDYDLPATLIGVTPYWLAAKLLEPDSVTALAAGGANIQVVMSDGTTPLMAAAGNGAVYGSDRRNIALIDGGRVEPEELVLETVKAVLASNPDVNAVNENGDAALHSAASQALASVVQLLVDKGAQVNLRNYKEVTPLSALNGAGGPGRNNISLTPAVEAARRATADLLRKLGATE